MSQPKLKVKIVKIEDLARRSGFATGEQLLAACAKDEAAGLKLELSEALLRRYEARKARRAARGNTEWLKFIRGLY